MNSSDRVTINLSVASINAILDLIDLTMHTQDSTYDVFDRMTLALTTENRQADFNKLPHHDLLIGIAHKLFHATHI